MEPVEAHHYQQNRVSRFFGCLAIFVRSLVMGYGLSGPFQNFAVGALLIPCYGSNLHFGAPFRRHPIICDIAGVI